MAAEFLQHGSTNLRHFYARRLVRMYPALLLLSAFAAWTIPPAHTIAYLTQSANWLIIAGRVPNDTHVSHLWFLSVEWQLLAVWPPLLSLLLRRNSRRFAVAVPASLALAAAIGTAVAWHRTSDMTRIYLGTDTRADSFLLGAALGLATAFGMLPDARRWRYAWSAATVAACLIPACWQVTGKPTANNLSYGGFTVVAMASAVVIARLTAYPAPTLSGVLAFPPLVATGKISYGLYLWHLPAILAVKLLGFAPG